MLNYYLRTFLLFLLLISFGSCEKFSGDQTIPTYISIDSIYLATDYSTQGSASHRITDAWVYIDNEFLGAYEMPARFPVLQQGKKKILVYPGIKKNGIAATRASYLFYAPIEKEVVLTPDSTLRLGRLQTSYLSTTRFIWREDFEDVALSIDTTPRSSAWITLTGTADSTFEGVHSARVVLDNNHDFFEAQCRDEYKIPNSPVWLEMNYNISNPLVVGVVLYATSTLYQVPVITLNPTAGQWKKIYIDLSTSLQAYNGMLSYRVYMGTFKDPGLDQGVILLDNLKIVSR